MCGLYKYLYSHASLSVPHLLDIRPHSIRLDVLCDERLADTAGGDEGEGAADDLLVLCHGIQQYIGGRRLAGDVGDGGGETGGLEVRGDAAGVLAGGEAQ